MPPRLEPLASASRQREEAARLAQGLQNPFSLHKPLGGFSHWKGREEAAFGFDHVSCQLQERGNVTGRELRVLEKTGSSSGIIWLNRPCQQPGAGGGGKRVKNGATTRAVLPQGSPEGRGTY